MQVLLLDEITVDLDVLGRADLMAFLQQECRERGATIIYVSSYIHVGSKVFRGVLCHNWQGQRVSLPAAGVQGAGGHHCHLVLINLVISISHQSVLLLR